MIFNLKGYILYSELSTLAHLVVGAVAVYLFAALKGRFARKPKEVGCQCGASADTCALPYCNGVPSRACSKGYCAAHCAHRSQP